jgi:acyl carrier protein
MEQVIAKVRSVTANILKVDESAIELPTKFRADLGADSINLIEIAMALESEFEIMLDDDEVSSIVTVEDAVNYILRHM